jgi:hypothetical protein
MTNVLCSVVAKCRERLAINKQAAQKLDVERFNLRKLNEPGLENSIRLRSETGFGFGKLK